MRGLDELRKTLDPASDPDPVDQLERVAKSFVAKRKTPDHTEIPLDGLRTDPDYQRPPDREKIAGMVEHRKAGGRFKAIKVNERHDGSRWITDGQHRAAAAALCGDTTIPAKVTRLPQQQEPQETNIVAKVSEDCDLAAITRLLGAGAQRHGKRLVLDLGKVGEVSYVPHGTDYAGARERGTVRVAAGRARRVLDRLGLGELCPENPGPAGAQPAAGA